MKRWYLFLLFLPALWVAAQEPSATSGSHASQPTIHFLFDWPQGVPWESYSVSVPADGKASFNGTPHADGTNDTDPYQLDFSMTEANREKMFELAKKLNYFHGDLDSHLKHVAQTGKKTLQYQSPQVNGSATYNWSQNPDVRELTHIFDGIATTIEFGRKLAFQYRFDKLGMDDQLKQLESAQADHNVEELQILQPILHKIWKDPNLMNISRDSAHRLLLIIDAPPATSTPTPSPVSQ